MASPALVLIHGGSHAGDCWEPTVEALDARAPQTPVLAVDLPGRRQEPGDLASLTMEQCVASVVAQIDAAGLDEVVLVGHSMAGITMPGVATVLGADRCREMVFLSCCIPPEGDTVLATLGPIIRFIASHSPSRAGVAKPMAKPVARWMFCNGMTPEQRRFALSHLHPDAAGITSQRVTRAGLDRAIRRTWIELLRDRSLKPSMQQAFIDNLGGVDKVITLDTCHNAMISEPDALAAILLDRIG
jgi:pimeloyl-ACP methyl ester carboxylesterase